jgi:hypothetical protein
VSAFGGDYLLDSLCNTAALDLDTDTLRYTLWNNTPTPDKNANGDAYGAGEWLAAREIYSTGQWAQAGPALASVTVTASAGKLLFDATDLASSAGATLTAFYGGMAYNDTTSDRVILFHYFGGSQTVTSGTLTLVWDGTNGLGAISY